MDFGEADRILTLYSRQHGKLRVIAKGARRPLSRLGPHLEYFCPSRLMLARGARARRGHRGGNGGRAPRHPGESRCVRARFAHGRDPGTTDEDRQENAAVFDLLASSLHLLAEGADHFHITRHYELALLTLLGYRPELYRCVECREKLLRRPTTRSLPSGGFLCELCRGRLPAVHLVSVDAQKYLRLLDRSGLSAVMRIDPGSALRDEMEAFFGSYLRRSRKRTLTACASARIERARLDPNLRDCRSSAPGSLISSATIASLVARQILPDQQVRAEMRGAAQGLLAPPAVDLGVVTAQQDWRNFESAKDTGPGVVRMLHAAFLMRFSRRLEAASITPGRSRATASMTTMAGSSPPVST